LGYGGYTQEQQVFGRLPATDNDVLMTDDQEATTVLWGTNISIKQAEKDFKSFLKFFTLSSTSSVDEEPFYVRILRQIRETEINNLSLDAQHLKSYYATRNLYEQLVLYPLEIITVMDEVVNQLFSELHPDVVLRVPIQVRLEYFNNLGSSF
jgi:DNA replication licensing factor MCM4